MIIHETQKSLKAIILLLLFSAPAFAQQLQPAPTFRLISSGYGAAALGMGGAFHAVANDLSAIYWNPAGVAQLPGLQIYADYRYMSDSDEDFSDEVFVNRFESEQRLSIRGDQLQAISVSYAFQSKNFAIVPAFAWQRLSSTGPERALKDIAGVVEFTSRTTFFQSEGTYREEFRDDEEEFTFGLSARASKKLLIGGTWSILRNGPEQDLSGTFHDSFITPPVHTRTDLTLSQNYHEDRSGNYLKIGLLFVPQAGISIGGTVRFPYTISSDISLLRTGPFVTEDSYRDDQGNITRVETTTGNLNLNVSAQSEIEVPMELAGGIAVRPSNSLLVTGSVVYSDYQETSRVISKSSDPSVIPNSTLLYPTLRPTASQDSLLQWRAGTEYLLGRFGRGLVIRSGIFWDGQPATDAGGDRVYFKGYSFGAGLGVGSFRVDGTFVSEKGDIKLTPNSRNESTFKNRRWLFSLSYISI